MSTISTNVYAEVILGNGTYTSPLTIDAGVYVEPTGSTGITAVYVPAGYSGASLANSGLVEGGQGGGIGMDLQAPATLTNNAGGTIEGGTVYGFEGTARGGAAVQALDGTLSNQGYIGGGISDAADGGVGVVAVGGTLTNGNLLLEQRGDIYGGASFAAAGDGGAGLYLTAGSQLDNVVGQIKGGEAYGTGGAGVVATGSDTTVTNDSFVNGGKGFSSSDGSGGVGVQLSSNATLVNGSQIIGGAASGSGNGGAAVDLTSGSTFNNYGNLSGGSAYTGTGGAGVIASGAGTTVTSDDVINGGSSFIFYAGNTTGGVGVDLSSDATMTNDGRIIGGFSTRGTDGTGGDGAYVASGASLTNKDTITGGYGISGGAGALVTSGGTLNNDYKILGGRSYSANGGTSTGAGGAGIVASGSGSTVTNSGTITGGMGTGTFSGGIGVDLSANATLTTTAATSSDSSSGNVYGGASAGGTGGDGADVASGARLFESNYVEGGAGINGGAGAVVTSGAHLGDYFTVLGGAASSGLGGAGIVATGPSTTVTSYGWSGGGASVDGNGGAGLELYSNATFTNNDWIFGGNSTNGSGGVGVYLDGGTLITSYLIQGGYQGATQADAVQFGAAESSLVVESGASFSGAIGGFKVGDTIDISNLTPSQVADDFNDESDTLVTPTDGTLQFQGNFAGEAFEFTSIDNGAGTQITITSTACFRRGTRITTALGEVAIEDLSIGDSVRTWGGTLRPIRWIGRRRYSRVVATGNKDVLPIRIDAGALGNGLPRRDLWVSPEHGLLIDGVLIPARALQNGVSIVQDVAAVEVHYLHLEFAAHEVIYAEGAPSESYVDEERRLCFDNAAEYRALYPQAIFETRRFCAPRIEEGALIEAVRWRLATGVTGRSTTIERHYRFGT